MILGVMKFSGKVVDTKISINAGAYGRAILAIASDHGDDGDETYGQVDLLRCGYDGDHLTVYHIAGTNGITYTVSDDKTIVINGVIRPQVIFIITKGV